MPNLLRYRPAQTCDAGEDFSGESSPSCAGHASLRAVDADATLALRLTAGAEEALGEVITTYRKVSDGSWSWRITAG